MLSNTTKLRENMWENYFWHTTCQVMKESKSERQCGIPWLPTSCLLWSGRTQSMERNLRKSCKLWFEQTELQIWGVKRLDFLRKNTEEEKLHREKTGELQGPPQKFSKVSISTKMWVNSHGSLELLQRIAALTQDQNWCLYPSPALEDLTDHAHWKEWFRRVSVQQKIVNLTLNAVMFPRLVGYNFFRNFFFLFVIVVLGGSTCGINRSSYNTLNILKSLKRKN
jgi:hypothetical protein